MKHQIITTVNFIAGGIGFGAQIDAKYFLTQVCEHIKESCSMEFDSPLLEETIDTLLKNVVEWITMIYGKL